MPRKHAVDGDDDDDTRVHPRRNACSTRGKARERGYKREGKREREREREAEARSRARRYDREISHSVLEAREDPPHEVAAAAASVATALAVVYTLGRGFCFRASEQ